MSKRQPFPFPPLPEGEVTPWQGPGDMQELLQRDVRIVHWFIEEAGWTNRRITPESTLGKLLALSKKVDLKTSTKTVDELDRDTARHGLHLSAALVRLAWAIRALHGNGGSIDRVDASFINDELLGEDSKERSVERTLPAGIGTLVFAGRLAQAGRGRIISINGRRGVGHDIKCVTGIGDTVYVERKDRSYEAGLNDTAEKRVRRVIDEIREARIPNERGACRILTVGFQHLVPQGEAEQIDRLYQKALKKAFKHAKSKKSLPHFVVVEHLGLEPRTGGEKSDFFSPKAIHWNRAAQRMQPLLVAALGAKAN